MIVEMTKTYIHACNLECPLPLLKTKLAIADLKSVDILKVVATDPTSWKDFISYSEISGNRLLKAEKKKHKYIYLLQKG